MDLVKTLKELFFKLRGVIVKALLLPGLAWALCSLICRINLKVIQTWWTRKELLKGLSKLFSHELSTVSCANLPTQNFECTANIYSFLLCPVSTVVSLYGLHLIPYAVQGRSYSKKTVISFTIIPLYLEQQLNVNHTVKLQRKVGHN